MFRSKTTLGPALLAAGVATFAVAAVARYAPRNGPPPTTATVTDGRYVLPSELGTDRGQWFLTVRNPDGTEAEVPADPPPQWAGYRKGQAVTVTGGRASVPSP